MNGNGYLVWNTKREKYAGKWENNLQNGLGVYIWYDNKLGVNKLFKDRYIGEWKEGKRDGYVIFFYSNGSIYEGYWKEDKKEGFGIINFYDKTKLIGLFNNDIFLTDLKDAQKYLKADNSKVQQNENTKKLTTLKTTKSKGRVSFFNINKRPTRLFEKKPTKIISSNLKETQKEDTKEKKEKEYNETNKSLPPIKENGKKDIKTFDDEIKIKMCLDDISIIDHFEKDMYKKLNDLVLRNLSLISRLYMYSTWRDDSKLSELGFSTGSPSLNETKNKSIFKPQIQIKKERNSKDANMEENLPIQKEEKQETLDNIYTNDLYYCLNLKNFWKLLRESGLITPDFSLAMVDRFMYKNPDNRIDMFFIPEELEKSNSNIQKRDDIYNYIYESISISKKIFEIKNKTKIDLSNKILNRLNKQRQPDSDYLQAKEENENQELDKIFDVHDEKNVILLRYFYEVIIRLAYLRFDEEINLDIEGRLKILLEIIKNFMRIRRKNKADISFTSSIIDPKLKNMDDVLEIYIYNHYEILKKTFIDIYKLSCSDEKTYKPYDMTITYRFFFDKIILNSEQLSELFSNKMLYIDLISYNFKDKKITSRKRSNISDSEIFEYLETLYDYEMIFREFCELVFYISRKFFIFYNIDTKFEDNKLGSLKKEEEKKIEEDDKRNKKKKKTKKNLNIDIYMIVLDEIINAKNILLEKKKKSRGNKYCYPVLKSHKIIERMEEEKRQKILEEKNREMDRLRYEKERRIFKEEDINIYKDEESAPKSNSEYESSEYD